MPAPSINPLPPAPSRANPAQFPARGDAFLGALPGMVAQINAVIAFWNTELDTSAFLNRLNGGVIQGTVDFNIPPRFFASAVSGEQAVLTLGKGATLRQQLRIANDGSLNILPLNGAAAQLRINNQEVYHTGNLPSAGDVGAVPSGSYTAADVRAKLLTVDGAGSGIDADLLDGQHGTFYRDLANATGTIADARLPSNIVRNNRRVNSGSGLTGGAPLTGDVNLAVDATVARRNAQNEYSEHQIFQSGAAYIDAAGTSNAHLWFRTIAGALRALIWTGGNSDLLRFRSYTPSGDSYREFSFNGSDGTLAAAEFQGGGSSLARLNASNIDRGTLPDARLASNILRNTVVLGTGSGLQGGGAIGGGRTFSVDATVVRTSLVLTAGNGLVGGGNLGANRAFALGTPGSITADSQNAVTAGSHTHYIDRGAVLELISRAGSGEVGTYGAFKRNVGGVLSPGSNCPGSQLAWSAFDGAGNGSSPTGTWKCMGYVTSYNGTTDPNNASLFLRIA